MPVLFFMRDRKNGKIWILVGRWRDKEDMGGPGGKEIVIRIYYIKYVFIKKNNSYDKFSL